MNTFAVPELFAKPPDNPALDWTPAIVYYRAVAAGYHEGARSDNGHFWALVRGMESARGAVPAELGYRRCNDAECTSGKFIQSCFKWDGNVSRARNNVARVGKGR